MALSFQPTTGEGWAGETLVVAGTKNGSRLGASIHSARRDCTNWRSTGICFLVTVSGGGMATEGEIPGGAGAVTAGAGAGAAGVETTLAGRPRERPELNT